MHHVHQLTHQPPAGALPAGETACWTESWGVICRPAPQAAAPDTVLAGLSCSAVAGHPQVDPTRPQAMLRWQGPALPSTLAVNSWVSEKQWSGRMLVNVPALFLEACLRVLPQSWPHELCKSFSNHAKHCLPVHHLWNDAVQSSWSGCMQVNVGTPRFQGLS